MNKLKIIIPGPMLCDDPIPFASNDGWAKFRGNNHCRIRCETAMGGLVSFAGDLGKPRESDCGTI